MSDKKTKTERLFEFLQKMERENRLFTISEAISATDYKEASVTTYISKQLRNFIVFPESKARYRVKGANKIDIGAFKKHMSQTSRFVSKNRKIEDRLIEKSLDAFLLSIEIYNRLTQRNRIEAFCILAINAWELFLKAKLIKSKGETALYYPKQPNRTLAVHDVVKELFTKQNNPIRKNIEDMIELRDKAVHLLLPELQPQLSRIFQSSVLNYHKLYSDFVSESPFTESGSGLISLIVDAEQIGSNVIQKNYGVDTANIVNEFFERFKSNENQLQSLEYAIPIEYKLAFTKNPKHGDLTFTTGKDGKSAILVEVPKSIDKTHPWREKDVLLALHKMFPEDSTINKRFFQGALLREHIRDSKNSPFYHRIENPTTHRYSDALIDLIANKVRVDSNYVQKCKESYSAHLKNKQKLR